jgi:lipoate-protein ligase A
VKAEEKVPGGKLVCIETQIKDGKTTSVRITGDFFLHPEDAIDMVERSLSGLGADASETEISSRIKDSLERSGAQLVGASAEDLARILRKAVI